MNKAETGSWYAVKCLFEHPDRAGSGEAHLYEERTTLWKANSFKEAEEKAEVEGRKYSETDTCVFLGVTDTFHLFDGIVQEGTEVFSTMRGSNFDVDLYRKTFCCTPADRALNTPPFGIKNQ